MLNFLVALQFLTISPPILRRTFSTQEMGRAVGWYPLVGMLLGGIVAGGATLLEPFFPGPLSAALTLALWVTLTGGLHLDGFLDACDGLLGGATPEKRMDIMRDHRIGAFAFIGGALLFLTKFSALMALPSTGWQLPALILAPTLGRWAMTLAISAFPYARPAGLGLEMKAHVGWRQVLFASLITLLAVWFLAYWHGLIALAAAALTLMAVASFTLRRIPGLTGDVYGMVCELTELAVLLLFAARGLA